MNTVWPLRQNCLACSRWYKCLLLSVSGRSQLIQLCLAAIAVVSWGRGRQYHVVISCFMNVILTNIASCWFRLLSITLDNLFLTWTRLIDDSKSSAKFDYIMICFSYLLLWFSYNGLLKSYSLAQLLLWQRTDNFWGRQECSWRQIPFF